MLLAWHTPLWAIFRHVLGMGLVGVSLATVWEDAGKVYPEGCTNLQRSVIALPATGTTGIRRTRSNLGEDNYARECEKANKGVNDDPSALSLTVVVLEVQVAGDRGGRRWGPWGAPTESSGHLPGCTTARHLPDMHGLVCCWCCTQNYAKSKT